MNGFPRPPYNQYRPRPLDPHPDPGGHFIRLHRPRRFDRLYRAGADHYVIRLSGWRLIFRLERDYDSR